MKNLFLVVFSLIFVVFSAFGQKNETRRLDRSAATTAWSQAMSLPSDTPAITAGGLVVESETNGFGRKVWLIATQSGTYLLQGNTCSGEQVRLGELGWETSPENSMMNVQIFDSSALGAGLPFFQLCSVEVIRLDKGKIERLVVDVNSWQSSSAAKVQVAESLLEDGRYQVSTNIPADGGATAILSRYTIGKVETTLFGSTITFPSGNLPPAGLTTLTVCSQKGGCTTTTFERKIVVPYSGGKG
jgi:hypothetical protein